EDFLARGLERHQTSFRQVHMGVLLTRARERQRVPEAAIGGAHPRAYETERIKRVCACFRVAGDTVAPGHGEDHERELVEIDCRIDDRAMPAELPRPTAIAQAGLGDEIFVTPFGDVGALLPAQ